MTLTALVRRSANPSSLLLSVGTVCAGTAAAGIRGNMDVLTAALCLLFALLVQVGANLLHAWCEVSKYYGSIPRPRIHDYKRVGNPASERVLKEGNRAALLLSVMVGITLMSMSRDAWWTLIPAVIVYGFVGIMNLGKHPLFRKPASLIGTFLLFGPVGVMSTALMQSQHEAQGSVFNMFDASPSIWMGIAAGFLALNVHLLNKYTNYCVEPEKNPGNLVAIIGKAGVRWCVFLNGLMMLAFMVWMAMLLDFVDMFPGLVPTFIGFALNTYIAIRMGQNQYIGLKHLSALTLVNYILTWGLTFIISIFIGTPDDSTMRLF